MADTESGLEKFIQFVIILVLTYAVMWPLEAITVVLLWGWFVVRVFHAPPLTFWTAIGLLITVGVFVGHYTPPEKDKTMMERAINGWAYNITVCGFALVLGGIVRLIVGA